MGAAKKLTAKRVDEKLLARYLPFQSMEPEDLKALASKCQLLSFPSNRILFRRGDSDQRTYFLVTGEIEIAARQIGILRLKAGTEAAREAIADVIPRRVEMRTTQPSTFLIIDRHLLEVTVNGVQPTNYQVSEMASSSTDDWMTKFLGSLDTRKIPPQNIQALLLHMKEMIVRPGQIIVRQDGHDNHYYIIKEGRCAVRRRTPEHGDVMLAELGVGAGFGEEAIITQGKRNATVTMLESGVIMRITKDDFLKLLVRPVVDLVTYVEAEELVAQGGRFVDVRNHADRRDFLEGAILTPMLELRARVKNFSKEHPYIVFCGNGQTSAAAAFLLAQLGFETFVLMGGIERVPPGARLLQTVRLGSEPEAATITDLLPSGHRETEISSTQYTGLKNIEQRADITCGAGNADTETPGIDMARELQGLRQELTRCQREIAWLMEQSHPEGRGGDDSQARPANEQPDMHQLLQVAMAQIFELQDKYRELSKDVRQLQQSLPSVAGTREPVHAQSQGNSADIVCMVKQQGASPAEKEDNSYVEAIRSWTHELERQLIKADALKTGDGTSTKAQSQYVQRRSTKK